MIRYWARLELADGVWVVVEIIDFNPLGNFHPSLIWAECSAEVAQQWTYDPVSCVFTSPDGTETINMPLSAEAKIAALENENASLQMALAELSILIAGGM